MTKAEKVKRARKWVANMQKLLPAAEPVRVSATPAPPDAHGVCKKTKHGFELRFDWEIEWWVLEEWLLPHEYTHARVWGRLQAGMKDHDAHFGVELVLVEAEGENMP